jgi:hypothetical protein
MNPDVVLYEEDEQGNYAPWTPTPTAVQGYLWELYTKALREIAAFAGNDPVDIYHVGDLTQGHAYKEQLVSTRLADQIMIAMANLTPWFDLGLDIQHVRLAQGTGSHVFREGSATILVAEQLRAAHPKLDIRSVRQGIAQVGQVKIDYAHHGPSAGIREWTEGNQLRYYAKSLIVGDIGRGKQPPRLIVRGHFHEWMPERVLMFKRYKADIFLLPSLCGMGEYGRQATGSKAYVSNGLVAVEIEAGEMGEVLPLVVENDLRTKETWE